MANIIGLGMTSIKLSFKETVLLRWHLLQQKGVLVEVSLQLEDYLRSPAGLALSLTENSLNEQMVFLGLRPIQSLEVLIHGINQGTNNTNSSTPSPSLGSTATSYSSMDIVISVVIGCIALIVGGIIYIFWRRRRAQINVSFTDLP
jgi:hypothetical protein